MGVMLPIVDFPRVVKEFAGHFRKNFSFNQLRRFKQYLTGLMTGGKATVSRMASRWWMNARSWAWRPRTMSSTPGTSHGNWPIT